MSKKRYGLRLKRVTRKWLDRHCACPEEVRVFCREWPDGAEISQANLVRAHELGLDLAWFLEQVLSAPARRAYNEAIAPARRAFRQVSLDWALEALDLPQGAAG